MYNEYMCCLPGNMVWRIHSRRPCLRLPKYCLSGNARNSYGLTIKNHLVVYAGFNITMKIPQKTAGRTVLFQGVVFQTPQNPMENQLKNHRLKKKTIPYYLFPIACFLPVINWYPMCSPMVVMLKTNWPEDLYLSGNDGTVW